MNNSSKIFSAVMLLLIIMGASTIFLMRDVALNQEGNVNNTETIGGNSPASTSNAEVLGANTYIPNVQPYVPATNHTSTAFFSDNNYDTSQHCGFTDEATSGLYYVSNTPVTNQLAVNPPFGEPVRVVGTIRDGVTGNPIPKAKLEVWHAGPDSVYYPMVEGDYSQVADQGVNYRGTVWTDENGAYYFDTVQPGDFEQRRTHFHYRVSAEAYKPIFTQTYWQGDPKISTETIDLDSEPCRTKNFVMRDGIKTAVFDIYLQLQ